MAKFKTKGFDKLSKQLKKMETQAKKLEQGVSVKLDELFTTEFMRKHTEYDSLDALFADGGLHFNSQEEFNNFPESELDKLISEKTSFPSWKEMSEQATGDYAMKQLGF